jgi:hypothetical protein
MCSDTDAPVFATHFLSSGQWEVLVLAVRELSGRHRIRRITVVRFPRPGPGPGENGAREWVKQ